MAVCSGLACSQAACILLRDPNSKPCLACWAAPWHGAS